MDRFLFRIWDKESQKYHNGMEVFDYMRGLLSPEKYVMEQSTGLKDKNGNLIYEGDILDNISIDEQYEVKWDEDTARFCCITDNEIYDFDNFDVTAFEILSNIHENADLLGENTDEPQS